MFSSLRKAWYQHQDRKIAKKYEPKKDKTKTKTGNSIGDKKPIIILAIVLGVVVLSILAAFLIKNNKSSNTKKDKHTSSVQETSLDETIEESTETETESLPLYTEEPTKKKKKEKTTDIDVDSPDNDYDIYDDGGGNDVIVNPPNNSGGGGGNNVSPKKTKPKRKANNKVPTQYEKNSIGSSKVSLIKNSVRNCVGGSNNSNMRNLAIYLANNGSSSANSALKNLCGYTTLKAGFKKATVKIPSNSKEDVTNATVKICNKLSGSYGEYGLGVSSYFNGSKYVVNVVVAYLK